MRSPIRWVGGKDWIAANIRELRKGHEHQPFVEMFAGSCAISFALMPEKTVLYDINPYLINFYKQLQLGQVQYPLDNPDWRFENTRSDYYRARDTFNAIKDRINDPEWQPILAGFFYFLNRTCYNGLWRVNAHGKFNVPYGMTNFTENKARYLSDYQPIIKNWSFRLGYWGKARFSDNHQDVAAVQRSLAATIESLPPDAFLYADPPYFGLYNNYHDFNFGWADHVWLADFLSSGSRQAVLSNHANDFTIGLYKDRGFQVYKLAGKYSSVAADPEYRDTTQELLAIYGLPVAR